MADELNTSPTGEVVINSEEEARAALASMRALEMSITLQRMSWARSAGMTFDGLRDMYGILGYKDVLTVSDYVLRYQRGGIAGRVIDVYPNATWRGEMELVEDANKEDRTPFEQNWYEFDRRLQVQAKLRRVDILSQQSTYAVLLIGDGSADMEQPLRKVKASADSHRQITYLTPFLGGGGPNFTNAINRTPQQTIDDGADATVNEYEDDPKSPRFGQPRNYRLKRIDMLIQRPVHWSRIIHVADGCLSDDVFGLPSLERVWNRLDDLEKVTGGGAEAFWLRANQGLHADIDKDMALANESGTLDKLKTDMQNYIHGLSRWMRTRGVSIQTLGSDVANFSGPADAILTQIAGAKGIPKRLLMGSEMGELASSQDRDNWKDQVVGRQKQHAAPNLVRALADRLIEYGYIIQPAKGPDAYEVEWSLIETSTEAEKAAGALSWSQTKDGDQPIFTDAEIRNHFYGMPPLSDEQRQERLDRQQANTEQQQQNQVNQAKEMAKIAPASKPGFKAAGDVPGHEFHGNQWTGGEGKTDQERQDHYKTLPTGTVVAKSKLGTVTTTSDQRFIAHRKNGETVGTKRTLREAKELLRQPREESRQNFPSGYLSPDPTWKYLGAAEDFTTAESFLIDELTEAIEQKDLTRVGELIGLIAPYNGAPNTGLPVSGLGPTGNDRDYEVGDQVILTGFEQHVLLIKEIDRELQRCLLVDNRGNSYGWHPYDDVRRGEPAEVHD